MRRQARRQAGAAVALALVGISGAVIAIGRGGHAVDPARRRTASLVSPGVEYYTVSQGGGQIGFASSTLDTAAAGVQTSDYFLADLQTEGETHRAWARIVARYTRRLHLRDFVFTLSPEIGPLRAVGTVTGDTLLALEVSVGGEKPDTQHIKLPGPLLLPNVVPLAVAIDGRPRVGDIHTYAVFDPMALAPTRVTVRVVAESTFVLPDSTRREGRDGRFVATHEAPVRAWHIDGGGLINGWIDARGRLVDGTLLGLVPLRRAAYELAYVNWESDTRLHADGVSADRDIQETTAISASVQIKNKRALPQLRVLLRGADLAGYDLVGARQTLRGDTLVIRKETDSLLHAAYALPARADSLGAEFASALAPEPLVQSDDPAIAALAARIAGDERDPRAVAERITRWVHDSLEKKTSFSIPNAVQVLRLREGDCNEHTQLFVALARAVGLPARSVAGLAYVGNKFYYHAWPEVYLGDWVAVDPTFGQFPADAAHLRFVIGGFKRQAELLKLIGVLQVDVLK